MQSILKSHQSLKKFRIEKNYTITKNSKIYKIQHNDTLAWFCLKISTDLLKIKKEVETLDALKM